MILGLQVGILAMYLALAFFLHFLMLNNAKLTNFMGSGLKNTELLFLDCL